MDPAWSSLARKNWQGLAALTVLAVFAAGHATVFRPTLAGYRAAVRRATQLNMPLDPTDAAPVASARIVNLLAGNSLTPGVAEEQGTSGALTAGLLDEATRLAARSGLQVVATEQGLVSQLPGSVQVHAHLKLKGRYAGFVNLLGALANSGSLLAVDRFRIRGTSDGAQDIEVWLSQLILKRTRSTR